MIIRLVLLISIMIASVAYSTPMIESQVRHKEDLIIKALQDKNNIDCNSVIINSNSIEKKVGKLTSPLLYYYRAQCYFNLNDVHSALEDLNIFFNKVPPKDSLYPKALLLRDKIEGKINHINECYVMVNKLIKEGMVSKRALDNCL